MDHPISKTQALVLAALGLPKYNWYSSAEEKFKELGIVVSSKRAGRSVEPVIHLSYDRGGWNAGGDGDSGVGGHSLTDTQVAAIQQWLVE